MHARADGFRLGLAVLTGRGVTAWRHALTKLATPRDHLDRDRAGGVGAGDPSCARSARQSPPTASETA
jgi:hypothetical protein